MEQDRGSDGRAAPGAGDFSCVIPDMECPDCAAKVERALRAQEGVLEVSVNVMGQTARVRFDPGATDPDGLTSAIREAGYQVRTETGREEEPEAAPFWRDPEKVRTALSGLFFAGGLATGFAFPERDHAPLWQGHLGWPDALFLIAAAVGGYGFLPSGLRALRRLSLDMDFLMTAAILGAAAIGEYAEAAAIAFLFSTAELLEDYAVDRARNSLRSLMKLAPETAVVRRGQEEITVAAEDVLTGDLVVVRPGEKVAVDGEVVEGSSSLDEATITGESMPVAKASGDRVFAGTLNQEGYLEVRATHTGSSSTLARIIRMVAEAEEHRAPSEQFVRRFARYYTPAVTLLAVAVMVLPPLVFGGAFDSWFLRGLTLLVIACPCALVISTPVAVVSGITSAARNGVLIKGGNYLEALGRIRVVAFDKTGTLTHGNPEVTNVVSLNGHSEEEVLGIAAALEGRSQHPIARAITRRAEDTPVPEVSEFESITGKGVRGRIGGETYLAGKPDLFGDGSPAEVGDLASSGKTVVLVGTEGGLVGAIAVADTVRAVARDSIHRLHRQGIRTVMLTGDNEPTARAIAQELGIDEWQAELLPEDKVAALDRLAEQEGEIAMVGDGVNDAPALAAAAVGIAMGAAGSDTALETADVALMADDLARLPYLFELSRASRRVIKQNVWASILLKLTLAAGIVPGLVSLATAVLVGDMGASLAVTGNALRLSRARPDHQKP